MGIGNKTPKAIPKPSASNPTSHSGTGTLMQLRLLYYLQTF